MKIKSIFFLSLTVSTLFFHNKTQASSTGYPFVGLVSGGIFAFVVIWKSGAGPKVLEVGFGNLINGAAQVGALPASEWIIKTAKLPFINPIDAEIKELVDQREPLSSKLKTCVDIAQANSFIANDPHNKTQDPKIQALIKATTEQQLKLEKKITSLREKQDFDQNRQNIKWW
jgi:hypothetical protein